MAFFFCGCGTSDGPHGGYLQIGKSYQDLNKFDLIKLKKYLSKAEPIQPTQLQNQNILYYYPIQPFATIYLTGKSGDFIKAYDISAAGELINYKWINDGPSPALAFKDLINEIKNRSINH